MCLCFVLFVFGMFLLVIVVSVVVLVCLVFVLDMGCYVGQWYEIVYLLVLFQKKCVGDIIVIYVLCVDGCISVYNVCCIGDGGYIVVEGVVCLVLDEFGQLQVCFVLDWLVWVLLVWVDYWVIVLDLDYQWVVVGDLDWKYLWILLCLLSMDKVQFVDFKVWVEVMGYDLGLLWVMVLLD